MLTLAFYPALIPFAQLLPWLGRYDMKMGIVVDNFNSAEDLWYVALISEVDRKG